MTERFELLHRLNTASAKTGLQWKVRILQPRAEHFEYNGGRNKMYRFECKLVGADPSMYLHGLFENSLEGNVNKIAEKMVDGSTWIMSNVALDTKA